MPTISVVVSNSPHTYGDDISEVEAARIAQNLVRILDRYAHERAPYAKGSFCIEALPLHVPIHTSVYYPRGESVVEDYNKLAREFDNLIQFACESQALLFEDMAEEKVIEDFRAGLAS